MVLVEMVYSAYNDNKDDDYRSILNQINEIIDENNIYNILQSICKCLKFNRQKSHPERLIGVHGCRKYPQSSSGILNNNFSLLIQWVWQSRQAIFGLFPLANEKRRAIIQYFQLSLILDLIKEFKKHNTYQLFDFNISFIFEWMSHNLSRLVAYVPSCSRIVDIFQTSGQLLSITFSFPLFLQYVYLISLFQECLLHHFSPQSIFPGPLSTTDTGFLDSSTILSEIGLYLFTLRLEILHNLLHQYCVAPTDSRHSYHALHENILSDISSLFTLLRESYSKDSSINLQISCLSWVVIVLLSENDKVLINTLSLFEEIYLLLDKSETFLITQMEKNLSTETHQTFLFPLNFSREILFVYFCQSLCFDEVTLIDIVSNDETLGLKYLLRITKFLESCHFEKIVATCVQLTNQKLSGHLEVSYDYLKDYDSETEIPKSADCRSIIWLQSEILLASSIPSSKKRKGDFHETLEDPETFQIQKSTAKVMVPPPTWQNQHNTSKASSLTNIFSSYPSSEVLVKTIFEFLRRLEWKITEMNRESLLPFDATPLLKRLKNVNTKIKNNYELDRITSPIFS